jgi:HD-GYP domain-containing protein (c-di-GMP phosphodiesterase class II)
MQTIEVLEASGGVAAPASADAVLDVLERFARSLQPCAVSRQQIRLLLEATCVSLGADVVYWDPGTSSDGFQQFGRATLDPGWCRAFTARLLAEEDGQPAQVLRPALPGAADGPSPTSAALVRVSRSYGAWLAALSFRRRRPFEEADLKAMALGLRMLLNHRQQTQTQERLHGSLFGLVRCLTAAIDAKDPYTAGHSERVARIAVRLGQEMRLGAAAVGDLYLAGLLHDIGKIGTRDSVLQKPGALTEEERKHIQEHPVVGDRLVSEVAALGHLRPGVRSHHERIDGKGYPDGLAGSQIPLMARVLAVADGFDAMMSARPYRPALPAARIDAILRDGAGTQWDPVVVEHFMACRDEVYPICQRGLGDSVLAAVGRVVERIQSGDSSSEG